MVSLPPFEHVFFYNCRPRTATRSGRTLVTNRTNAVVVTILVAALAIAAPIWVAVRESRHQAISAEQARAMTYAEDVLHRSDTAADQVNAGIMLLRASPDGPCSANSIALMRGI